MPGAQGSENDCSGQHAGDGWIIKADWQRSSQPGWSPLLPDVLECTRVHTDGDSSWAHPGRTLPDWLWLKSSSSVEAPSDTLDPREQ